MFRTLKNVWSETAFTDDVVTDFLSMIERSNEMFGYACRTLTKKSTGKKATEKIYVPDQSINITECNIRRKILLHLATHPEANLSVSLVLMSVTKDAERLGDYVKNLFELQNLVKSGDRDLPLFRLLFETSCNNLLVLFKNVQDAYRNSDAALATQSIRDGDTVAKTCQAMIEEVADGDFTSRQAVLLALGARYMKRIARHLTNIATAVVNPLPSIDFEHRPTDIQ